MRQVPEKTSYVIVGNGRVARHFCHYLSLLHIPFSQWSRSENQPLSRLVEQCTHALILMSDSAIEDFIRNNKCLSDKRCVHFSGSLVTDLAYGAHPLMTFGPDLYLLKKYLEIPWVIEKCEYGFADLLPGLPNASYSIDKGKKDYYHALCVMANNFTTLLWQQFFNEMQTHFHIPKKDLLPILQRTMSNLIVDHEAALTGPLVRNDELTIKKNLAALEGSPLQIVYEAFVNLYKET